MKEPKDWKYPSASTNGLHTIISPQNSICAQTYVFRLNLDDNQTYVLNDPKLELNGVVIEGEIEINFEDQNYTLKNRDSFYLPVNQQLSITAKSRVILYIGGALYEGRGKFFTREFDLQLSEPNIR